MLKYGGKGGQSSRTVERHIYAGTQRYCMEKLQQDFTRTAQEKDKMTREH